MRSLSLSSIASKPQGNEGELDNAHIGWSQMQDDDRPILKPHDRREVARLLTDPKAVPMFQALADAPTGSAKAIAAATRLALIVQSLNR